MCKLKKLNIILKGGKGSGDFGHGGRPGKRGGSSVGRRRGSGVKHADRIAGKKRRQEFAAADEEARGGRRLERGRKVRAEVAGEQAVRPAKHKKGFTLSDHRDTSIGLGTSPVRELASSIYTSTASGDQKRRSSKYVHLDRKNPDRSSADLTSKRKVATVKNLEDSGYKKVSAGDDFGVKTERYSDGQATVEFKKVFNPFPPENTTEMVVTKGKTT